MLLDSMDLFYESIINEFESQYGSDYKNITEQDINDYFSGIFYLIEDEIELDIVNDAEEYIRERCRLED